MVLYGRIRNIAPGAVKEKADQVGVTPLLMAAQAGDLQSVRLLLDAHAEPDKANDDALLKQLVTWETDRPTALQNRKSASCLRRSLRRQT